MLHFFSIESVKRGGKICQKVFHVTLERSYGEKKDEDWYKLVFSYFSYKCTSYKYICKKKQ